MNENKDILDSLEMRQRPYSVPDSYFDNLEMRLAGIPGSSHISKVGGMWVKVRPALAMAASFAAILFMGSLVLKKTAAPKEDISLYEQYAYADLIPHTEPFAFFEDNSEDLVSEEDIINYLLESRSDVAEADQ